jgi:hypothetical protein
MSYPHPSPRRNLMWAGVDLDGTLAAPVWTPDNPTSEIGAPLADNVLKVYRLYEAGYKIIIHTSRPWTDYEAVESWLRYHGIPFREIQCGKPLFAVYVDDRARNARDDDWFPWWDEEEVRP